MKFLAPLALIAFAVGISVGFYFIDSNDSNYQYKGGLQGNTNFTLHDGEEDVSLSDFKNKAVFIFFGYTSCPDVCPTSLAFMGAALKALSDKERNKVQVLFISVDPDRDTTEKLRDYTKYFHADIKGITGTKQEIDKVVKQYGAAYQMVESDSAMGYLVDHSASFYALNKKGKLVNMLPHGFPVEAITKTIRDLI